MFPSFFAERGWRPFPFQREVWRAYARGESGLIHAATGTGKTYAAWLGALAANPAPQGLSVLWITPLRALVADTLVALKAPAQHAGLPWKIGARTGDTTQAERARQDKRLPHALVTTPESLSVLLSKQNARELFRDLECVIVDEWHELISTKRGVQTELCLARLRRWHPDLRTWGLSATLGNLETAAETLLARPGGRLVRGLIPKKIAIDSLIPERMERFPWAGHLGVHMLPQVIAAIEESGTTLVFTNTRSQVEIWYQALLAAKPDWAGRMAVHHGSLDRKTRDFVEDGLRAGSLKCVVCTSSLDLGVDFTPVDRVLQIGSPKGVARLLQRAGRSGHRPGAVSRVTCVPTHAWELVETAAARDAVRAGRMEAREPVVCPLDVLTQHLVTVACGEGFTESEMLDEVRSTVAYRSLDEMEWRWAMDFITRGGEALRAYPDYRRVVVTSEGPYRVTEQRIARRHLLSIGTIASDAAMAVRYMSGGLLGTVEEGFLARLRPGDRFLFAGKSLEFVHIREMTAWVRRVKGNDGAVPRWEGGRMPLSSELSDALRRKLEEAREGTFRGPEMKAMRAVCSVQTDWSRIPRRNELLIERVKTREGWHLFFYPFDGLLVHEGLAALFAWRMSRLAPITFTFARNDYGFELFSPQAPPLDEALAAGLLSAEGLSIDIDASLNATEMARRQFREIARIAGLVFTGYPGANKTAKQLQASSGLIYDVFAKYDPDNRLLDQARREVLERQLERTRLKRTLERLSAGTITVVNLDRPSPLAFPLLIDISREKLSSEKLADRVRRMVAELEAAAG